MKKMDKKKNTLLVAAVLCGLTLTQSAYAAEYTTPIRGDMTTDTVYVDSGVTTDGITYTFTEDATFDVGDEKIAGGPWFSEVASAISSTGEGHNTILDLKGNKLNMTTTASYASTGLTAINQGVLTVNNPGDMTIVANGQGPSAALWANGGGEIYIHNADGGVLTVRSSAGSEYNASSGAVIKTMNGARDVESKIIIDGMVDVVADVKEGSNEAVSCVASRIEIGGGNIVAKNGAWAAIRAYGEFVSTNYGIVNVNVVKDEDGNLIGAGDRKTTITGDFVTNGGMGTKGQISVGLNGKDSFWEGNYADTRGYGYTPGELGAVNLWVRDGAHWKGFSNGSLNLDMSGEGSYWYGFSVSEKMFLQLKDGAVWQNAISAEQKDKNNNTVDSRVGTFIGDGGYIDMTGAKVFTASSSSLNSPTSGQSSWIEESENGITGNLVIDNFSGNTTVLYKSADGDVIGGNTTIKQATEGSAITLSTENDGIAKEDLTGRLNQLANKLYYTDTTEENSENLSGTVHIGEGLTTSSASAKVTYDENGQGSVHNIVYHNEETSMMSSAKSAMTSSIAMWRSENDDMMKRIGEVRNEKGDTGLWAKYAVGSSEMDAQNAKFKVDYDVYQIGFDKQISRDWLLGAAFSYNDGESSYRYGSGDNSVASISVYGTRKASNGTYLDLVAKVSRLDSDYTVRNNKNVKLSGDYDTTGYSFSMQYGKRFERENGLYFDPSVQFTVGRLQSEDYTAKIDSQKNMYIHQDSMDSMIGKLGVGVGQKTDRANVFAKFALAHEFSGDFDATLRAQGESLNKASVDFGGTWCELEIGGGIQVDDRTMLYATYERSFGGDVTEKYRIDGGVRFSF